MLRFSLSSGPWREANVNGEEQSLSIPMSAHFVSWTSCLTLANWKYGYFMVMDLQKLLRVMNFSFLQLVLEYPVFFLRSLRKSLKSILYGFDICFQLLPFFTVKIKSFCSVVNHWLIFLEQLYLYWVCGKVCGVSVSVAKGERSGTVLLAFVSPYL